VNSLPLLGGSFPAPAALDGLILQPEDCLWPGLTLPILSNGEFAALRAALGQRVHFHDGVWWEQFRPLFCLPCSPLAMIPTNRERPAPHHSCLGFTHLVPPGYPSNGSRQMIVAQNIPRYSIATLSRKRRTIVRRALSNLQVRPIKRLDDLLTDGYNVYVSWHRRNGWGRYRASRAKYAAWISRAYSQPKRLALGAFHRNGLVAFCLMQAVGSVADPTFIASHTLALPLFPNDALFHAILTIARQSPGIESADFGPVSAKPTLNDFKLHYASLKTFPSYTWINPLVRPFIARWIQRRYPWLHPSGPRKSASSKTAPSWPSS